MSDHGKGGANMHHRRRVRGANARRGRSTRCASALLLLAAGCFSGTSSEETPGPGPGPAPPGPPGSPEPTGPQPIAVPGTTYYVNADTGSDEDDGLTPATAWQTLAAAGARVAKSGGDKLVLEGTFAEPLALFGINRPASNPALPTVVQVAFDSAGSPLQAVIDGGVSGIASFPFDKRGLPEGFGPGTGNYLDRGITVFESDWITISGVEIRGIIGPGIRTQNSSHIRVEHVTVEWCSESGMKFLNGGTPSHPPERDLTVAHCRLNQLNLGSWWNESTQSSYNRNPESLTIVLFDGFVVHDTHISNSLQNGILFKMGARNGVIRNNLIENTMLSSIYANEGLDTDIYQNVVRNTGYYDPENGTGLQLGSERLAQMGLPSQFSGSTGVHIGNGDMQPEFQSGRASGIRVFENTISFTVKAAISVHNEWRNTGKTGWLLDDIHIFNNVAFENCRGALTGPAAIPLDVGMTNSTIVNNIVVKSAVRGIFIVDESQGTFLATNVITHNLQHQNAQAGTNGQSPRFGDPKFVQAPAAIEAPADFQLGDGSPAIDTGLQVGLPTGGTAPDVGAFQRGVTPWSPGGSAP